MDIEVTTDILKLEFNLKCRYLNFHKIMQD